MDKIWRISKHAIFKELRPNHFIIMFAMEADKQKVLAGRPWHFDNFLLAMKLLDNTIQPKLMSFDSELF